tara:strand:- start:2118 stop:2282 length:165 start_codon:yes stop_codon:yes gene_type:complete
MDELLTTAYDLKHQVETLPDVFKHEKCVDRFDTGMSMINRVDEIIRELEKRGRK